MATTHSIVIHLRPGVQSIAVQYRMSEEGNWVTVLEGGRVVQGATVRFTVTTYPNFTLTEWEAYYADEYDDTVNLPLSPITGQSAWEFTMPPAGPVEIRCEAEGGAASSTYGRVVAQPALIKTKMSYGEFVSYVYPQTLPEPPAGSNWTPCRVVVRDSAASNLSTLFNQYFTSVQYGYLRFTTNGYIDFQTQTISPFSGYPVEINDASISRRYTKTDHYHYSDFSVDETSKEVTIYSVSTQLNNTTTESNSTSWPLICGAYFQPGTGASRAYASISEVVERDAETVSSIRYIMSPEGSGEVDAGAPSEFVVGTTEFTFKWRIKVGYSLRRITPFAVGTGSLEDDVVYSSTYDGETRTFTITVQQIPNWAIGVRVLIECINGNDPNVGGSSGTGGGNGTFNETSDRIPVEPMPSISAADAGMITLFRPTLSELKQLGAYLWTNIEDFIDNLKKMFSDPMDTIIALNILPGLPPVGMARNIRLGVWETNVSMLPVLSQWYELNFGTVRVDEFWGSALDYSPNTKVSAMLPFIGSVQLDTDDVMGREVGLLYRIDLLSGHLVAMITINDDVIYQFTGECAVAVPLTGADWSRVYGAIAGTIGATAVGVAGAVAAGASAGVASNVARMGALKTAVAAGKEFRRSGIDAKGVAGVRTMRQQMLEATQQALDASADIARSSGDASVALKAGVAAHAANNVVGQIMSGKVSVAHSGTISGSAGLLGLRRPYIYVEYPNQSLPDGYKHFYGYPSNMRAKLGELSGFTQCYQVLINGFTGTDGEFGELLEALKEGVYL